MSAVPITSPTTSRTIDRVLPGAAVVLAVITVALALRGGSDNVVGRAFVSWVFWSALGVYTATRGLREPLVRERGNAFRRTYTSMQRNLGVLGLLVAAALILLQLAVIPHSWQNVTTRWVCVSIAAVLLLVNRKPRQLGAGLLIAAAAPVWPLALLFFMLHLAVPTTVTVLAAIASSISERHRNVPTAETQTPP